MIIQRIIKVYLSSLSIKEKREIFGLDKLTPQELMELLGGPSKVTEFLINGLALIPEKDRKKLGKAIKDLLSE